MASWSEDPSGEAAPDAALQPSQAAKEIPTRTDVLIVGAGPTGLTLAIDLARRGVDFVLVDMLPRKFADNQSRALAIQSRSLEILSDLKLVDKVIALSNRARGIRLSVDGKCVANASIPPAGSSTPFPFPVLLEQSQTERILTERLEELGHKIWRPVAVWKFDNGWRVPEPVGDYKPVSAAASQHENVSERHQKQLPRKHEGESSDAATSQGGSEVQPAAENGDKLRNEAHANSTNPAFVDPSKDDDSLVYSVATELKELTDDGGPLNERFRTVRSRYIVGCDGAHSIVRKSTGIKFEGDTQARKFVVADIKVTWGVGDSGPCSDSGIRRSRSGEQNLEDTAPVHRKPLPQRQGDTLDVPLEPDYIHVSFNEFGFFAMFPLPKGIWRIVACNECVADDNSTAEAQMRLATPDATELQYIVNRAVPNSTVHEILWKSCFSVSTRLAASLKQGRCFLAGDSAHIHPPTFGQGMNTGIQDAYNLGWKLSAVLKGEAHPSLLDSYDVERRQVAGEILKLTSDAFTILREGRPGYFARCCISTLAPVLCNWELVMKWLSRTVSMVELKYKHGTPLIAQPRLWYGSCETGQRAPDALVKALEACVTAPEPARYLFDYIYGGHHTLLLFLNVLPVGARATNVFGCKSNEEALRWNVEAFEKLAKISRLVCECLPTRTTKEPETCSSTVMAGVRVVWVICGMVSVSSNTALDPPMNAMRLLQQIPQGLLLRLRQTKIPGKLSVLADFIGDVSSTYGLSFSDPGSQNGKHSSGCFVFVRPDGYVCHTGYAGDSVATAEVLDYCLKYFTR